MRGMRSLIVVLLPLAAGGCPLGATGERSAFQTYTETFAAAASRQTAQPGGGGQAATGVVFREPMTLVLANANADAELRVLLAAWVEPSSIRSAEQQDALLADGYVQLSRETRIGTAFTLAPGTFVLNGPGVANSTPFTIGTQDQVVLTLITPDVILAYLAPPVSCESPAFAFSQEGFPPDAETAATLVGGTAAPIAAETSSLDVLGIKTLAQVNVYQCDPFRPGLFFRSGGGARAANEYGEGDAVRFDFTRFSGPIAAFVTIEPR